MSNNEIHSSLRSPQDELRRILHERVIRTCFQPIVSLRDGVVLGYEALSRGPAGTALESPVALFALADEHGMGWELDHLCRTLAIERFAGTEADKLLFLNVDPYTIQDPRSTARMKNEPLSPAIPVGNIIFELTENGAIANYGDFCQLLDVYKIQGIRVAVDDAGAGYSGWNLLCQIKPAFVKIDGAIVRDIHRDAFKQQMMKVMVDFTRATNTTLIAEGIETESELLTLLELGVEYGQGYYLCMPKPELAAPPPELVEQLRASQKRRLQKRLEHAGLVRIGDCCESHQAYPASDKIGNIQHQFTTAPELRGVTIVDKNIPVGLVMRDTLFSLLGQRYGYSLYENRSVSSIMDSNALIVDFNEPLEVVAQAATSRGLQRLYDNIIVTLNGHYFGMVTIITLLERITEQSVNFATYSNPLTGLPGNVMIERVVEHVLHQNADFSVLYLDLDNFKAYNDTLGFERGDGILRFTADLLRETFPTEVFPGAFIGHIGGDDFVVVLESLVPEEILKDLLQRFDSKVLSYYDEQQITDGYIVALNRRGEVESFPFISISIAVVTSENGPLANYQELARRTTEVKKVCKATRGSCVYFDRRRGMRDSDSHAILAAG